MKPMNAETVVLEEARPIEEELAARLIYDTGSYVFDCLYNRDFDAYLKITAHLWQQDVGAFSHRHAKAATYQGGLAGIALGFPQALCPRNSAPAWRRWPKWGAPSFSPICPPSRPYSLALPGRCRRMRGICAFFPPIRRRAAGIGEAASGLL